MCPSVSYYFFFLKKKTEQNKQTTMSELLCQESSLFSFKAVFRLDNNSNGVHLDETLRRALHPSNFSSL